MANSAEFIQEALFRKWGVREADRLTAVVGSAPKPNRTRLVHSCCYIINATAQRTGVETAQGARTN